MKSYLSWFLKNEWGLLDGKEEKIKIQKHRKQYEV